MASWRYYSVRIIKKIDKNAELIKIFRARAASILLQNYCERVRKLNSHLRNDCNKFNKQ